jgi:hypothetical protein
MTTAVMEPREADEVADLLRRAEQGDQTVLPQLRAFLQDNPHVWRKAGDLAWHAEQALVRLIGNDNPLIEESLRLRMDDLRADLLGPAPTALERLLVDRVVLSWAQVHAADLAVTTDRGCGPAAVHAQRQLDSASKRYLAALKQLAQVRVLLRRAGPLPDLLRPVA